MVEGEGGKGGPLVNDEVMADGLHQIIFSSFH